MLHIMNELKRLKKVTKGHRDEDACLFRNQYWEAHVLMFLHNQGTRLPGMTIVNSSILWGFIVKIFRIINVCE